MIEAIVEAGITEGCSGSDPKLYCPSLGVTRGQMASFLQRALDLPAPSRDWFRDDDGNVHEDAINRIADAGIASGTSADRFSPDLGVTRAQMASFIARAFDTPPAPGHPFDDVAADSVHAEAISSVAQEGIVHGCNAAGTLYCPAAPVRRDQMASFLGRALQLEPAP